jgi:hypothetical protein
MKNLTLKLIALMVVAAPGYFAAYAQESSEDIEARIEQAREKLQEAARTLAELETRDAFTGERKLMIGILLADSGGKNKGIGLAGVMPSGGAEEAGLQKGDTATAINGVRLDQGKALKALRSVMKDVSVGDSINLEYLRDGTTYYADVYPKQSGEHMVKVITGGLGDFDMNFDFDFDISDLSALAEMKGLEGLIGIPMGRAGGLELRTLEGSLAEYFDVDEGVLVLSTGEGMDNLLAGDVIRSVAGAEVTTSSEAHKALAKADGKAAVKVIRKGKKRSVQVDAEGYAKFSWRGNMSRNHDGDHIIVIDKQIHKENEQEIEIED